MTERKVCTIELTEFEAIGLLELAQEAKKERFENAVGINPETQRATQKLAQALAAEQGTGGNFAEPGKVYPVPFDPRTATDEQLREAGVPMQKPEWFGNP